MSTTIRALPSLPCSRCGHTMRVHDHVFDEPTSLWGVVPRYRCNRCSCGTQYLPRVYALRPGETPEDFMRRVTSE